MNAPEHPPSTSGQDTLAVAVRAAREAGAIIKNRFAKSNNVENKGKRNLVTEADLLAEKSVLAILNREYPDHNILGEESGQTAGNAAGSSHYLWVIDPLDGTTNYAFGVPLFCVSIALTYRDELILGVIYDPLREELFHAQKGEGAFLNNTPIHVTGQRNLQTTLIGFDMGYDDTKTHQMISLAADIWSPEITYRLIGSAALGLTYVACGRLDIYLHRSLYPWDIAAAILIIREAGGHVSDWKGEPASLWNKIIFAAANNKAHPEITTALQHIPD